MNPNKLLRLASLYYSLASSEELPKDSDDLKTVLSNLEQLDTYAARKKYAERNLKHLSSGSSRIVYLTPGKTIVKLAKNDKGIAQNEAEGNPKMKSKYLNKVLGRSKDNIWIEVCYLDKITVTDFEKMTGLDFDDFGNAICYALRDVSGNDEKEKPKKFDEVSKSDIYKEIKDLGDKFKILPGDMARISSWGTREGHPVLIDAGLTRDIFDKFYEDSSS